METRSFNMAKSIVLLGLTIFGSVNMFLTYLLSSSGIRSLSFYTGLMFIGEFLCIFIYPFRKKEKVERRNDIINGSSNQIVLNRSLTEKFGKFSCCMLAVLDYTNDILLSYSISHLWLEIVSSLMMISIFYLFFYHKYILRRNFYKHKILGMIVFSLGTIATIVFLFIFGKSHVSDLKILLYTGLMAISQLLLVIVFVSIEKIVWTINITVEEINVIKGLTGIAITAVLYIPFSIIDNKDFVPSSLEDPFLKEKNEWVIVFSILYVFSMFVYNYLLVKAIKISDSLAVCMTNSGRMMVITMIFFIIDPGANYINFVHIVFSFIII